jgi:DNA-binding NarL/FixJ family response regulator
MDHKPHSGGTPLRMPRMDDLEATRQIKKEFPRTIVLVLTASEWPYDLSEALKAGAAGYVLKGAPIAETIDAVRKVVAEAMRALSEQHAGYGFERNCGYGTPEHRAALAALGPCRVHRLSYAGVGA